MDAQQKLVVVGGIAIHLPVNFVTIKRLVSKGSKSLFSSNILLYVNTKGERTEMVINFLGHSSAVMASDPAEKVRVTSEESAWFSERVDQLTEDERWLDAKAVVQEFFLQGPIT